MHRIGPARSASAFPGFCSPSQGGQQVTYHDSQDTDNFGWCLELLMARGPLRNQYTVQMPIHCLLDQFVRDLIAQL